MTTFEEACRASRLGPPPTVQAVQRWRIEACGFFRLRYLSDAAKMFERAKRVPRAVREVHIDKFAVEVFYDVATKTVKWIPFWEHLG